VVGGGFAGLNCALGLLERGVQDVVLVDAQYPGFGASGRNGGFVFGGYSLAERELLRQLGPERAKILYQLTLEGVDLIRGRAEQFGNCDFNPAGVLLTNWFADDRRLFEHQELLAQHFDVEWSYLNRQQLRDRIKSERYAGALLETNAFHFQPFNYAQNLLAQILQLGGQIFERTQIIDFRRDGKGLELISDTGRVDAELVVFCGGGYQAGCNYELAKSVLPIATFVMTTEPLGERLKDMIGVPHAIYDTRFAFDYYRPLPDGRLLWGGRIAGFDADPKRIEQQLRYDIARVFPQLKDYRVDHVWSGLMGYTRHKMPQLGRVDERVWYAQGFGGHGVSTSNIGGDLIARAIAEGDETYQLFEPFGLANCYGRAGQYAAQLSYWYQQAQDGLREQLGGRP